MRIQTLPRGSHAFFYFTWSCFCNILVCSVCAVTRDDYLQGPNATPEFPYQPLNYKTIASMQTKKPADANDVL
jgi:hypothetical protein